MWWLARWSAATVFFLAVMAGAGYYVYDHALRGGNYVEVPDITLRPITEAAFLLAEKDLEMGRQEQVPDERIPKYYVITQRPAAGKVVRTGRKVYPMVSAGTETLSPPNLIGKTLKEAEAELGRASFHLGTVARLPHASPRDMVIAQDPAPNRLIATDTRIGLLVSDGQPVQTFIMPDIMYKPVQEMLQILSPLGVNFEVNPIELPDEPFDVVLYQEPPPGTLIKEGDLVTYSVRPSGTVELPDARRSVRLSYTAPFSWFRREIRVDVVDRNGVCTTAFPLEKHYVDGLPPKIGSGETLTGLIVSFIDEMTVRIYLDNQLAQSQYYKGDAEPAITDYTVE